MSRRPFICVYCYRQQFRTFASSTPFEAIPKTNPLSLLPDGVEPPPPYPYGSAKWYKQRNTGLYGNAMIQFGNHVGEKFNTKTRRTWHPNVVDKSLYSQALDQRIRVKVHSRVLRTIDKVGGLDEYLVGMKTARIKELGEQGWKLRWAVLHTNWGQERIKNDAELRESMMAVENEAREMIEDVKDVGDSLLAKSQDAEAEVEAASLQHSQEIEERIQRRLEGRTHMVEANPPSIWSRFTSMFRR